MHVVMSRTKLSSLEASGVAVHACGHVKNKAVLIGSFWCSTAVHACGHVKNKAVLIGSFWHGVAVHACGHVKNKAVLIGSFWCSSACMWSCQEQSCPHWKLLV